MNKKKFNPTVKDFLKENDNISLLGLTWAIWWRAYIIVFAVYLVAYLLIGF